MELDPEPGLKSFNVYFLFFRSGKDCYPLQSCRVLGNGCVISDLKCSVNHDPIRKLGFEWVPKWELLTLDTLPSSLIRKK